MTSLPSPGHWLAHRLVLVVAAGWLAVGAVGVVALHRLAFVARVLFPLGGLLGLVLSRPGARGAAAVRREVAVLPIGLPSLPFHLRLDSLAAFFLLVIGAASAGISVFAAGYFRKGEGTPPGLLCLEYHVFLASMVGVVLADDAYAFMVMWETMALSSFFLVTANHRIARGAQRGLPVHHDGAHRRHRHPAVLRRAAGQHRRLHLRQHARRSRCRRSGPRWASCWRCSASAPRPASCRCTCGCPRRTRRRRRRCRR